MANENSAEKRKGCSVAFYIYLGLFLLFTSAWYYYLRTRIGDDAVFFSILCGLMSLITVWTVKALFLRDHDKAIERALQGLPLLDGQWGAALGIIRPTTKEPLAAPFSGQEAVAYEYLVSQFSKHVPGPELRPSRNLHLITAYSGYAFAQCQVVTSSGNVNIEGKPALVSQRKELAGKEYYEQAGRFIAATAFTDAYAKSQVMPPADHSSGIIREDRRENPGPNLEGWKLDELVVRTGEQVCVYGLYCKTRHCLMAPPQVTSGRMFSLVTGDVEKVKGTSRNQRWFFLLTGLVLLLIQALILYRTV